MERVWRVSVAAARYALEELERPLPDRRTCRARRSARVPRRPRARVRPRAVLRRAARVGSHRCVRVVDDTEYRACVSVTTLTDVRLVWGRRSPWSSASIDRWRWRWRWRRAVRPRRSERTRDQCSLGPEWQVSAGQARVKRTAAGHWDVGRTERTAAEVVKAASGVGINGEDTTAAGHGMGDSGT